MTIKKICESYPNLYICVKNCIYECDNNTKTIKNAVPLYIYTSMDRLKASKKDILRMIKTHPDFYIIYGNLKDYISTKKNGYENTKQKKIDIFLSQIKNDK